MNDLSVKSARLYSKTKPSEIQTEKFNAFLTSRYGDDVVLEWIQNDKQKGGFRLEINDDVYDWSLDGRLQQLKNTLKNIKKTDSDLIPLLKETINSWTPKALSQEIGTVLTVGDGIATVSGLDRAEYGEILMFSSGVRGMIQDLKENEIGCILFDNDNDICEGTPVRRTGKTAGMPVGEAFIGRVVDALGNPIDGKGAIECDDYYPIERHAPGIIDRQSVDTPLETGILTIDSMFPIGKGQRELIIGDRQTGKTAIAVDTILNQKGKDVICIYVAIGQKASSVAKILNTLKNNGAMEYSIIVNASAGDSASLQYIAPYAGCALGEYFMNKGKDVLIVYDDLSKHAVAYRSISLLLGRSPGREAYPGDVFYLHSRLLERSAHLSEENGGGSMTALPIAETQSGDVSAYIPTNIISITDGQIFLESELFFSGQRPAVNVGLSVSRVGGNAQTKAMKKASGAIRLDLAQYHEMEVFTQFASELDSTTKRQLNYGEGLMQILIQEEASPYKQYEQVLILVCVLNRLLEDIPKDIINSVMRDILLHLEDSCPEICNNIEYNGVLSDEDKETILKEAQKAINKIKQEHRI